MYSDDDSTQRYSPLSHKVSGDPPFSHKVPGDPLDLHRELTARKPPRKKPEYLFRHDLKLAVKKLSDKPDPEHGRFSFPLGKDETYEQLLLSYGDAETMKKAAKKPNKPFLTSQEYADEEVKFLMKKMKAYLYYPKGNTKNEMQEDFVRHIENYDEKYREDLAKWTAEINAIIKEDAATKIQAQVRGRNARKKDQEMSESGGGKEMRGGAGLSPNELERLALLAIEYKRSILHDDIIELNKKTIGLTLNRINDKGQTEHNVLVQVPIEYFNFSNIQRIQVGASKFQYGVLSTRHVYHFNTDKLGKWLGEQIYTYPQLGTTKPAEKITNIVFRNSIVEYEVTKKSILGNKERMKAFNKRLTLDEKKFLTENKKHFETLLLKTKHVDKVFESLKFHPGNRGHIIYTIKQFFHNEGDKKSSQLDKLGVFQLINSNADKQTYGIKDVFTELGINKAGEKAGEKAMLEKLDEELRNSNFSKDTETTNKRMKQLSKRIEKINKEIENLEIKKKQQEQEGLEVSETATEIERGKSKRNIYIADFKRLHEKDNSIENIKQNIDALIMSQNGESPYTGLWFNLTIPGNHTWILFYVNGKFCSVGGGYNNDREYKLAFYSPDPVFDYDNHWLFPLMMNNWGFIDKNITGNLEDMAESIRTRGSEGFVTKDLKYSLLSNRLSSLCGYYNCASTADKILGQSVPMTFSHPSFSRGGKYTYTSQVFEALNIDYTVELALSATERYQKIYSRLT